MTEKVTNYQCPACTGPLHFDPERGKLACDYCGSTYTVEEIEAYYRQKDQKAAEALAKDQAEETEALRQAAPVQTKADAAPGPAPTDSPDAGPAAGPDAGPAPVDGPDAGSAAGDAPWDTSQLSQDWGQEGERVMVLTCPSCGAQLICDAATAATACPYCGNPSIIPGQLTGALKPDYVIPFKKKKDAALEALKGHYKGRPYLPDAFTADNHIQEVKGIYVPFWLFDGTALGSASYEGLRTSVYTRGDDEITETAHYDVRRTGSVSFSRIPVDGSKKMPDE